MRAERVILVSYHHPPVCSAGAIRTGALAAWLDSGGYEVVVLRPRLRGTERVDPDLERMSAGLRHVGVYCPPIFRTTPDRAAAGPRSARGSPGGRSLLGQLIDRVALPDRMIVWLPFLVLALRRLLAERRPLAVICSAPPFSSLLAVALGLLGTGVPLIADYRDPWTLYPEWAFREDFLRKRGLWTRARLGLERRLEALVLGRSRAVVAVTPGLVRGLRELHPEAVADKWTVVRNGVVGELLRSAAAESSRPAGRRFVLTHVGNFHGLHGARFFLAGLGEALDRYPKLERLLELRLYGNLRPDDLAALATLEDRLTIRRSGVVGYAESLRAMAEADALLVCQPPWVNADCWLPMKTFAYLSLDRPILAVIPPGELDDFLPRPPRVERCAPDRPEAIAHALHRLVSRGTGDGSGAEPPKVLDFDFSPFEPILSRCSTATGAAGG